MSSNSLEQLKATGTVVVTDTGEFECMYIFKEIKYLKSINSIRV